jgi:hypothetical protein
MATETEQLVVALEARIRDFERNFQKASQTANREWSQIERRGREASTKLEGTFAQASKGITLAMNSLKVGLAGIGAGSLLAIGDMAQKAVASTAAIGDLADKTGISIERLQELAFGATQANLSFDDLDGGLLKFSRGVGQAAQGQGELLKVLQSMGISLFDITGRLRPLSDILNDFTDSIEGAADEQQALAAIVTAFGRGGDGFLELLRDGRKGLDDYAEGAHRAGAVVDEELVRKAQKFDDAWAAALKTVETNTKAWTVSAIAAIGDLFDGIETRQAQLEKKAEAAKAELAEAEERLRQTMPGFNALAEAEAKITSPPPKQVTPPRDPQDRDQQIRTGTGFVPVIPSDKPDMDALIAANREIVRLSKEATDAEADRRAKIEDVIDGLRFEADQLGRTADQQRIYEALQRAGIAADSERGREIMTVVGRINDHKAALQRLRQAQEELNTRLQAFGELGVDGIDRMLIGGAKLTDVLQDLAGQLARMAVQAAILGQGPLAGLFGTESATAGQVGGILGGLFLAEGGMVRGPGTSNSDSVPAMLSNGEFVIRADQARKHQALLEAINSGKLKSFARGGPVGFKSSSGPSSSSSAPIAITNQIHIEGSAGTPEQNRDLADQLARQVEASMRSLVARELRQQIRPGGMLR